MKKLIYVFSMACFFMTFTVDAQTPMVKGTNIAMIGAGIGGYGSSYYSTVSPTIAASYVRGIVDDLGPGNLSVGGTVAFKSGRLNGLWSDVKWNYFALSARASYHPHFVKSDKFDAYAGIGLGYYKSTSTVAGYDYAATFGSTSVVAFNAHIGARYFFTDQFAAWAEIGNNLSLLSVGAAMKF